MKKQKTEKKPVADFKTNPFKALKGFVPQPAKNPEEKKQSAPLARPGKGPQEEDEAALFLRSVEGARRLAGDPGVSLPRAVQASEAGPQPEAPEDARLFLQAMRTLGATLAPAEPEPEGDGEERRSATSRTRQLKRGTISISETLDLHGYGKDEALRQLARFIAGAYQRGSKAVLVITGKGLNSPDGPVLQGSVNAWLREQGRGMVVETAQAPRDKGGSGAVVVFLRTNRTERSGSVRS